MAIEIRELLIKVKVEEGSTAQQPDVNMEELRLYLMKECKKEIRREMNRAKER